MKTVSPPRLSSSNRSQSRRTLTDGRWIVQTIVRPVLAATLRT